MALTCAPDRHEKVWLFSKTVVSQFRIRVRQKRKRDKTNAIMH